MNAPIIPPPDLRNIIDKTATFVARNGLEFEAKIHQNEQNNPKFNFLRPGDPYNAYYQFKVREIKEGNLSALSTATPVQQTTVTNGDLNRSSTQPKSNDVQSKLIRSFAEKVQIVVPSKPPPDYEFMSEAPSVLALDLDIIKLTARFVAIHGRSFLTNLMNKEQRNYQFDFLRPQHGLFSYFTQLIEQYTKIINQPNEILDDLRKDLDQDLVWKKINYRLEWTKIEEAKKRKVEEEIEKERVQYAQIDWHDFVIVETVDYQLNEQGIFPPPTTPDQVGSRILIQQRIEQEQATNEPNDIEAEINEMIEKEEEAAKLLETEEEKRDKEIMPPPSLPTADNIIIRKDYDPKKSRNQATSVSNIKGDSYLISPITKEKIPAEKLAEHMRYGLLDPTWIGQREKAVQEKLQQEEVYAQGNAIENSLKQMAERRTDIFGSGIDETEIGKKIGEEAKLNKDKITWDGYSSSMEAAAKKARANVTIEDQIQQIHKMKGLVEEDNKDKIGPAIVPVISQQQQANNANNVNIISSNASIQQLPSNSSKIITKMPQLPSMSSSVNQPPRAYLPPQPTLAHHPNLMQNLNPMMNLYPGMPPHPNLMQQHPLQPNLPSHFMPPHPAGHMPVPPLPEHQLLSGGMMNNELEPAHKKQRVGVEGSLMPEEEWLATHSGTLTLTVNVPNIADKPELNMNGQCLAITLNLTDMVSVIKNKINEQIGLAPGKQKLQYEGIFIKDSNTLAFYNMSDSSIIQLGLKERGGRKK